MSFFGGGGRSAPPSQPASTTQIVREAPGIEERKIELMDLARQVAQDPVTIPAEQVAGLAALEQAGLTQAGQTGVGSGTVGSAVTGVQSAMAPVGAQQISQYFNPFQQFVTSEIARQGQIMQNRLGANAVSAGAFGGGREGALLGQFDADSVANRAGITAQLLQSGFQDAANRRAQALQDQFALSNFQRQNEAANISNLGQLGAFRQGLDQSRLQADATAAQTAAFEPLQRLQQYGSGLAGLSGFASPTPLPAAAPSPFSTALSTALGIGGLFGKFR